MRAVALGALGLVLACSSAVTETSDEAGFVEEPALVRSSAIWTTRSISVCWESPLPSQAQRTAVRAGARKWEAVTQVRFTGWAACASGARGIRVLVASLASGRSSSYVGRAIDGVRQGMKIHVRDTNRMAMSATHEFGHALGFLHEQSRDDTPQSCYERLGGPQTQAGVKIGAWDLRSVMNYCNPAWNGDGNLSTTDIAAAQRYYGGPTAAAFEEGASGAD